MAKLRIIRIFTSYPFGILNPCVYLCIPRHFKNIMHIIYYRIRSEGVCMVVLSLNFHKFLVDNFSGYLTSTIAISNITKYSRRYLLAPISKIWNYYIRGDRGDWLSWVVQVDYTRRRYSLELHIRGRNVFKSDKLELDVCLFFKLLR